jgi:3-phytase
MDAGLTRGKPGQLATELATQDSVPAQYVAETIQRAAPDVLLLTGFDYDQTGRAIFEFQVNYLAVPQNGAKPIRFAQQYVRPVNTGIASGYDLDHDGRVITQPGAPGYSGDSIGGGDFPGQRGMVLLSRFPIDEERVRTFQRSKWRDMPGSMLPTDARGRPWFDAAELNVLRLSSANHWDVPLKIEKRTVHVLASAPSTRPSEGPEQRTSRRIHDELRIWVDYIPGGDRADYLYDDTATTGRRSRAFSFVLMAELPPVVLSGSNPAAEEFRRLMSFPAVNNTVFPPVPAVAEAPPVPSTEPSTMPSTRPTTQPVPPELLLDAPSRDLKLVSASVFEPPPEQEARAATQPSLAQVRPRLVYIDVKP